MPGNNDSKVQRAERPLLRAFNPPTEGFCIIDRQGRIRGADPAYCDLLGYLREELIGMCISDIAGRVTPEGVYEPLKEAVLSGKTRFETALRRKDGSIVEVGINVAFLEVENEHFFFLFVSAFKELREAESYTETTDILLKLFAQAHSQKEYLDAVVDLIQRWGNCRCVGIRILDDEGNIPYKSYLGFDKGCWESENWLSVNKDNCICVRVITERPELQDAPCMTPAGSFYCDNILQFISELSEQERARFRGVCFQTGYKSVAVIPVRYREKVLGAIYLADEMEGMVPFKVVRYLESVSSLIGEAVNRFDVEGKLRRNYDIQTVINSLLRLSLEDISLEELLNRTLDLILSIPWLAFASTGAIFLVEDEPGILVMKAQSGLPEEIYKTCARVPFGRCLCGRAASEKEIQFADRLDNRHENCYEGIRPHGDYCVPIAYAGRVLGVINVHVAEGHRRHIQEGEFFVAIANTLASVIQQKRAEEALRKSEASCAHAQRIALLGNWDWSIETNELRWSEEIYRIFGISPREFGATYESFLSFVYPDDREFVKKSVSEALLEGKTYAIEHRILRPDGVIRMVQQQGEVAFDETGRSVRMVGTMQDITERKRAEEERKVILSDLNKRVKELKLLHQMASIFQNEQKRTSELLHEAISILPAAWQYPEITAARITFDGKEFATPDFKLTPWRQSAGFHLADGKQGVIEVIYLEERTSKFEGPFLAEERSLINSLAEILRSYFERKRAEKGLKNSLEKLQKTLEGTVNALATMAEMRDPYIAGHQQRVAQLACAIAREMGLGAEQIDGIRVAGTLHDIGKIYVPAEILNKPGPLSDIEMNLIKTHPQIGYDILKTIEFPWPVALIVLQHHERMGGSGYPSGLAGEEIVMEARILSVADVVEAMSFHRPYRPSRGLGKALEEISQNMGILYDPEIAKTCLKLFTEGRFRF